MSILPQYVTDAKGKRVSVIVNIKDYERLLAAKEELEDIEDYDRIRNSNEESVPFEQAIKEIEEN